MAVLQAWEREKNMSRGMGRWEPPSTHTPPPPPTPSRRVQACCQCCSPECFSASAALLSCHPPERSNNRGERGRKKGRRKDCFAGIPVTWQAVFVGSCTIWDEADAFLGATTSHLRLCLEAFYWGWSILTRCCGSYMFLRLILRAFSKK